MNHRNVSLFKSAIRVTAVLLLMRNHLMLGCVLFLVAEAIGVVEEFV